VTLSGVGDRSIVVHGAQSGGLNVTGDGNQITVLHGTVGEQVTVPATLEEARRLLYGNPRPPAAAGRSVVGWLAAGAGIVAVQPRRDVADLTEWVLSAGEPVMRLVTGAGGQGKTVLGQLVCDQVAGHGWLAGFARLPPPGWRSLERDGAAATYTRRWARRWAEIIAAVTAMADLAAGGDQSTGQAGSSVPGALLVVDYAENQAEALSDLLAQIVAPVTGRALTDRVRVLLLARHDRDWWPQLSRDHPDHSWVDVTPVRIGSLGGELSAEAGADVWAGAVAAFAARAAAAGLLRSTTAHAAAAVLAAHPGPGTVSTTLDLYAAALLVVLDHAGGTTAQAAAAARDAGDPLGGVLDHEERYVAAAVAGAGLVLDDTQRGDAVTTAFLVPARDLADGAAALSAAPSLRALGAGAYTRLATELGRIYSDAAGGLWRAPVPDRLPDTQLLRTLERAAADDDAAALVLAVTEGLDGERAAAVLTTLTRAASTPGATLRFQAGLRRLAMASQRLITTRPGIYLIPAITLAPVRHQRAVLEAIPELSRPETIALDQFLRQLGFTTTRTQIAVSISAHLRQFWLAASPGDDPARKQYAEDLGIQATRLFQVGRREEALAPAQEAVTIGRRLAKDSPAAYLPDLASALNKLGAFLSEVGRREEALAPAQEAVTIGYRLAEANPAAYLPDLAGALNNLQLCLSGVGRREEALVPAREAVTIGRMLAEANPAAYLPDLAGILNNLGSRLSDVGLFEEALAPTRESVTIRRMLAEANPAAYLPDLAMSLNNFGVLLSEVGRRQEALAPTAEAVTIRRRLAKESPDAYLPDLAMSLSNLGVFLSAAGRREEALTPEQDAVAIRRRLAEANPDAYLPDLAKSLSNLGVRLSQAGRREEALAPAREAVTIGRRLAEANPAAYLPDLAMSLWALGWICAACDLQPQMGLIAVEEAAALYAVLTQRLPAVFSVRWRAAQITRADLLDDLGRHEQAAEIRGLLETGDT
jgi:tetratricopeptide (TPR) repeat protein